MAYRHSSIVEAYSALGLEQGSSLETVKSAYKQLALKTHPDKNPNDSDATAQFQQVSSAYSLLLKHLDTSQLSGGSFQHFYSHFHDHSHTHFHGHDDDDDYYSDDYELYDSSEDEYYHVSQEDDLDFFMFLFEEMMHDRANQFTRARFRRAHMHPHDTETEEQYQARLRREREGQEVAAARRKAEEIAIKRERQKEREQEILAGRQRREQKSQNRKAEAEASRKVTAQKVRMQQEKSQCLRSSAFAAARKGDAAVVKKAVWEDGVDAAGGEVKPGLDDYVKVKPKDPMQTLLHIAVIQGDGDLVEWLEKHNAEAEERDSHHLTPFHVALQYGRIPIIRYFLEIYPPGDSDSQSVLNVPNDIPHVPSLLRLALHSGEPEAVWLVLDTKLVDSIAIQEVSRWIYAREDEARAEFGVIGKQNKTFDDSAWEEVKELLMNWGGFAPPLTPETNVESTLSSELKPSKRISSKKRDQEHLSQIPTPPPDSPPTAFRSNTLHSSYTASRRGHRNRGRGHGNSGSRGRGRGRGQSHTSYTHS